MRLALDYLGGLLLAAARRLALRSARIDGSDPRLPALLDPDAWVELLVGRADDPAGQK